MSLALRSSILSAHEYGPIASEQTAPATRRVEIASVSASTTRRIPRSAKTSQHSRRLSRETRVRTYHWYEFSYSKIRGNFIGTDLTGFNAVGNSKWGVYIHQGAHHNQIGDGNLYSNGVRGRNVISGHNNDDGSAGVLFYPDAGPQNSIVASQIGVSIDSSLKIPNRYGVIVFADDQLVGPDVNGSDTAAEKNVIAGNQNDGILVSARSRLL